MRRHEGIQHGAIPATLNELMDAGALPQPETTKLEIRPKRYGIQTTIFATIVACSPLILEGIAYREQLTETTRVGVEQFQGFIADAAKGVSDVHNIITFLINPIPEPTKPHIVVPKNP